MLTNVQDAPETGARRLLDSSDATAFFIWLLITVSSGIIMAQDTVLNASQPRMITTDATAGFTKVLVIHSIWLIVSLGFILFSWLVRPISTWKVHIVMGAMTTIWTIGVLVWAFQDVDALHVTTWSCETQPTNGAITQEFLDDCEPRRVRSSIRMGEDIFLWSANDIDFWRPIVAGEGLATLQTRWPNQVSAMYLATNGDVATLISGSAESVPGGTWTARFDPHESLNINLYYVESPTVPIDAATPDAHRGQRVANGAIYHDRFRYVI